MEDFLYTNALIRAPKKPKRFETPFPGEEKKLSLNDCLLDKWKFINEDQIKKAYCHDLTKAIEQETIKQIIQKIFEIESNLKQLNEKIEDDENIKIPHLEEFYKNLTPVFLRSLLEMPEKTSNESDEIFKGWIEALRIAVEEEIYFTKENLPAES